MSPSPAPSHSPTPGDSNPENNVALCTEELEAHIEAFLEEVEEDLEMNDLPPLENTSPLPVLVGNDMSPARSEDAACCMEAVGQDDLAAVLARNLAITQGLRAVDTLLIMLCVWEVQNFEWWERSVAAGRFQRRIGWKRNHSRTVSGCR